MKQSRPEQEAFVAVVRAADRLAQETGELLRPHGITGVQYNVLRILRGAHPESLNCGQIAGRMINREPDMTRLLDRLEAREWVKRERPPENRRTVLVSITEAGLETLQRLDQPVLELHRRQFARLNRAQVQQLIAFLSLAGISKERADT
jgi:DNA-binding MarR family transcriptional regulator